jgi:hypothetical protein
LPHHCQKNVKVKGKLSAQGIGDAIAASSKQAAAQKMRCLILLLAAFTHHGTA